MYIFVYGAWTIPGVSWDSGLVTWESWDTWTGEVHGLYNIATLYILRVFLYGGQSQECPGKVWLRGNHGIDTWTGPSDMHSIYIYILYMCGGQSQECPGMVWLHGNPGILGQGGSLETLLYTVHVHGGQSQECPGKVWLRGNPGILGRGG